MPSYIALIPAYKPDKLMLSLIDELTTNGFEIVIVNDGSGTDYNDIFDIAKSSATVLGHDVNMGKGCALKTGLEYVKEHYISGTIVTLDADGQHKVSDALKICNIANKNKDSLILGSRSFDKSTPLRSRFGNSITRLVYRLSTGIKVRDTQTGLRAFDYSFIDYLLKIDGNRYEYEMNVLLQIAKDKKQIIEEEIETIYIDNNSSSHFNALKDSFRVYKEILKFSASSFIGFVTDYFIFSLIILCFSGLGLYLLPVIANISARIVSASVNFTINKKLVFKSEKNMLSSALQYFVLALFILAGNTIVLNTLINHLNINSLIAKLITEILFFAISYLVQKKLIFRKEITGEK
ncbi:MAG: glycosyltransferase [Ruminococcaceae bacterium]|nr:glycosyltransferase [Oscillospiraceae bacterium]